MEAIGLSKFMEETKNAAKDFWGCRPHTKNMLIPFHTDLMGGVSKISRGGACPACQLLTLYSVLAAHL